MEICPACGDLFDDGRLACSGACMRVVRFAEIAAGRPDPMNASPAPAGEA